MPRPNRPPTRRLVRSSSSDIARVIARLDNLTSIIEATRAEIKDIRTGEGMVRCALAKAETDKARAAAQAAHKRIDGLSTRLWWAVTTSVSAAVAVIVGLAQGWLKGKIGV